MAYNQSDESNHYNKQERGGWYCTNPKRHDESHQHHAEDDPHEHSAARKEDIPDRQPESKQSRRAKPAPAPEEEKVSGNEPVKDATETDQSAIIDQTPSKGCLSNRGCLLIIFFAVMAFVLSELLDFCSSVFLDESGNDGESYGEYYNGGNE